VIFFDRSPLATAIVTSAMLRTWPVKLLAIELTLSVKSFQTPVTSGSWAAGQDAPARQVRPHQRLWADIGKLVNTLIDDRCGRRAR